MCAKHKITFIPGKRGCTNSWKPYEYKHPHSHSHIICTHVQRDPPDREWFPRLQCMSLNTEEVEPEQNEMKDLQQQLRETTAIVRVLSHQLGELRDRVSN